MNDQTTRAVQRQIRAMHSEFFEVGLYKPSVASDRREPEMLTRTWDESALMNSIPWLRHQNLNGRNIYVRPKGEHSLTLIDDLTADSVRRMKQAGFTPAAVVQTSPGNFQAWVNHGQVLPRAVSTAAARKLAADFGGDPSSADWRHYGRLVGFTNRKPNRILENGLYPFVTLTEATGRVYERATSFVKDVEQSVEASARQAAERRSWYEARSQSQARTLKTITEFRSNPVYGGDGNRIDLAYAVYAISHGVPEGQVREAIGARDLSHKGSDARQSQYIERTVKKAIATIHERGR